MQFLMTFRVRRLVSDTEPVDYKARGFCGGELNYMYGSIINTKVNKNIK